MCNVALEICRKYKKHGIVRCETNHDLWMRDRVDHSKYVAFMIDNPFDFIQDLYMIIKLINKIHQY